MCAVIQAKYNQAVKYTTHIYRRGTETEICCQEGEGWVLPIALLLRGGSPCQPVSVNVLLQKSPNPRVCQLGINSYAKTEGTAIVIIKYKYKYKYQKIPII